MKSKFPIAKMGLCIAIAVLALANSSFAALEVETEAYGSPSSPLAIGSMETLSLPEFDTTLGTLTGVTLELFSYDTISSVIFSATGQSVAFSGATATVPVKVTVSDSSGALDGLITSVTGTAGPFSGTTSGPDLNIAGSVSLPVQTDTIAPADFPYQGSGPGQFSFSLSVANSVGSYSGSGGPSLFFGGNGYSYGSVVVDYTYTPEGVGPSGGGGPAVPEPGTLYAGLALAGLCGIQFARRFGPNHSRA